MGALTLDSSQVLHKPSGRAAAPGLCTCPLLSSCETEGLLCLSAPPSRKMWVPRNSMVPAGLSCPGTPHAGMGSGQSVRCQRARARQLGSWGPLQASLCPGWQLREIKGGCNTRGTAGTSHTAIGVAKEALSAKAATKDKHWFYCMSVDALMCQTAGWPG